ncbi:hypothetical protein HYPSUDRAFT_535404 [Hypholoma sublateritium FD-334 SS-4]|uniref:Uncharacterized protein n=1 Tax=Hypholoma sublateritium (strain FD-334 SS-4) TaxID=945553 RepID=A0A0D2LAE3_HYPSF|nr:hypothetical protein HYPSUDRAFT_535404 [Hypholoma sublateritium FD-334 SS-4]
MELLEDRHSESSRKCPPTSLENHTLAGHLGNLTLEQEQVSEKAGTDDCGSVYTYERRYQISADPSGCSQSILHSAKLQGSRCPEAIRGRGRCAEGRRKKRDIDKLYEELGPNEMLQSQYFYPRWTGRRDKLWTSRVCTRLYPHPAAAPVPGTTLFVVPRL